MRFLKADELAQDTIEEVLALNGEALDLSDHIERIERTEMGKVAVLHAAIYQANRATEHGEAWGIIETAADQVELLSEDTLTEVSLLHQALKDQQIYAALIAKFGDPELKALKSSADERIAKRHAARRLASRGIKLEIVAR